MFYLIQLLNAVQYGLLLFLLSSGLTLIFGVMGVINLAHGSFYMVGAYLTYGLAKMTGSLWLAIPIGVIIAFAIGLLLETTIIRRLYRRDHLYQVLLTFGLILIFEELRSIVFGDEVHGVAVPEILNYSIALTDTLAYPVYRLFVTAVCLTIAAMEKAKIDSPRGPWTMSKAHNPIQDIYLRKVVGRENRLVGVAHKALADPARGCKL